MSVKVSVNLPDAAVEALEELAQKRNTTITEVLLHAISLEKKLDDEVSDGARILIQKDGQFSELLITNREGQPVQRASVS